MTTELLGIGEFAASCRLTVKRLRNYAASGLLPPAWTDPHTGYRYYRRDQAEAALTIALLRDLDVPLASVARIVAAAPAERRVLIEAERRRVVARMAADRRRLEVLERLGDPAPVPVVEVTAPPLRLAVESAECAPEAIGEVVGGCVSRLFSRCGPAVSTGSVVWGLFPVRLTPVVPVQVGVVADVAGPSRRLPGGAAVSAVHVGGYGSIPVTYHALFAALHGRGLTPSGPVREEYLVAPGDGVTPVTRVSVTYRPQRSTGAGSGAGDVEEDM
ncbi:MerR family transcriptional regulator [Stackebrandtia albiflava]|nr:MerR family transcriptional regulator [Stackebrandtia albiflava]